MRKEHFEPSEHRNTESPSISQSNRKSLCRQSIPPTPTFTSDLLLDDVQILKHLEDNLKSTSTNLKFYSSNGLHILAEVGSGKSLLVSGFTSQDSPRTL